MTTTLKNSNPNIKTYKRIQLHMPKTEKKRTQQQFAKECDINNIMAKYQKTGVLSHVAKHEQDYGFADSIDFNSAMQLITQAEQMFGDLPSSLRNKFHHNPSEYLDYVQNEDNYPEMAKMGLLSAEAAASALAPPEPTEVTPPADPLPGDPEPAQ